MYTNVLCKFRDGPWISNVQRQANVMGRISKKHREPE